MQHEYIQPGQHACPSDFLCPICDGGLSVCKLCGLFEGSLTTECPGYQCWHEKGADVYAGRIDFRAGAWVEGCTIHMAHVHGNPT